MAAVSAGVEALLVAGEVRAASTCCAAFWVVVTAPWKVPRLAAFGWDR